MTSPGFSLKFDQMREGNPTWPENEEQGIVLPDKNEGEFYEQPGTMRNVCFFWSNGKREFLPYAYLVWARLESEGEKNTITLLFTSHSVILKGYGLQELYLALMEQRARLVSVTDVRYLETEQKQEGAVIEIVVSPKE